VSLAIDDFGTDYAALSNQSLVKAHKLKMDASFIRDLTTNATPRASPASNQSKLDLYR
jgi:EAL domain-containing protein (putative c-di-GMP-specific phosphodiesterase class I)